MTKSKQKYNMSIRAKLITIILLITTIVLSIGFIIVLFWLIQQEEKKKLDYLAVNANLIGEYCVVPLSFNDSEQARSVLQKLRNIKSIKSCVIYTTTGAVFAAYGDSLASGELPRPINADMMEYSDGCFKVALPIVFENRDYGSIYIEADNKELTQAKRSYSIGFALLLLVLSGISFLLARRVEGIISGPILKLNSFFKDIAVSNNFSLRVSKNYNDEIGDLYDSFNNLLHEIETKRDEKDLAEELLKSSKQKLDLALEGGEIGVWEWDLATDVTIWDKRMEEIFGLEPGTFGQDYASFKACVHPLDLDKTRAAIQNAIEQNVPYNIIYRAKWKNGEIHYIAAKAVVSRDDAGKALRMTGICLDLTEVKKVEEELKIHQGNLEELVKKRTKDLEEKNKELERFNSLFVDREFRIKELRDKLKKFEPNSSDK